MSRFFKPNISRHGRIARGVIGTICVIAGGVLLGTLFWIGLILIAAGLFAIFEALRGWCLIRACGIKTKL